MYALYKLGVFVVVPVGALLLGVGAAAGNSALDFDEEVDNLLEWYRGTGLLLMVQTDVFYLRQRAYLGGK